MSFRCIKVKDISLGLLIQDLWQVKNNVFKCISSQTLILFMIQTWRCGGEKALRPEEPLVPWQSLRAGSSPSPAPMASQPPRGVDHDGQHPQGHLQQRHCPHGTTLPEPSPCTRQQFSICQRLSTTWCCSSWELCLTSTKGAGCRRIW